MKPNNEQRTFTLRRNTVAFLIKIATEISVSPIVKYSALSLLVHRFYPSLSSKSKPSQNWLLNPNRESNLQLVALISLWISSKIHGSPQIHLKTLKSLSDRFIADQHFTRSDFLDAEIQFLHRVNFEIGTMNYSAIMALEELLMKLKEVARVGDFVNFEACLDVMDLMYEDEAISRLIVESPICASCAILVAAFVITVPKQRCEFPLVSWLNFVTRCSENDILGFVKLILHHVLELDL